MSKLLKLSEVIERSNKSHNNKYNYSKFEYINNHTKGIIICPIHNKEFKQIPNAHLRGQGCPECAIEKNKKSLTKSNKDFIKDAKKIHGNNKFDYSKVDYKKSTKKINIICKLHGCFKQTPQNHLQGNGCNKCRYKNLKACQPKLLSIFIAQANKVHTKNKYNYSKLKYKNANTKGEIICPKHGSFFQTPNHHLRGNGCPRCKNIVSKFEKEFLDYLKIPDTKENRQKYIKPYRVDGFDETTHTIYEYLGDYYHGNPEKYKSTDYNKICHKTHGELYKKTINRLNKLKEMGYNVKYIWENDWKQFIDGKCKKLNVISIL